VGRRVLALELGGELVDGLDNLLNELHDVVVVLDELGHVLHADSVEGLAGSLDDGWVVGLDGLVAEVSVGDQLA